MVLLLLLPLTGSIGVSSEFMPVHGSPSQYARMEWTMEIPNQVVEVGPEVPWWERTTLDNDRNHIHDSLQGRQGKLWIGLSYGREVVEEDLDALRGLGITPKLEVAAVDAILLGAVDSSDLNNLTLLDGVVMVEEYGLLRFHGDIQTPAVKASASDIYPDGAWNLSVSGHGINIALTDTGVDSEHPGLVGAMLPDMMQFVLSIQTQHVS